MSILCDKLVKFEGDLYVKANYAIWLFSTKGNAWKSFIFKLKISKNCKILKDSSEGSTKI